MNIENNGKHEEHTNINIKIDTKHYKVEKDTMTGQELKTIANVPKDYSLYLENQHGEDLQIDDITTIEIKSGMTFYSVPSRLDNGSGEMQCH